MLRPKQRLYDELAEFAAQQELRLQAMKRHMTAAAKAEESKRGKEKVFKTFLGRLARPITIISFFKKPLF